MTTFITTPEMLSADPIDAVNPSNRVSQNYKFYSTREIVNSLAPLGWLPNKVLTTRTRNKDNRPFAKHIVRLRNEKFSNFVVDGNFPEMVIINSHDATSSLRMLAGIFRMVCSNGMIRQSSDLGSQVIQHKKLVIGDVIARALSFGDTLEETMNIIPRWQGIEMSQDNRVEFATKAYALKYPKAEGVSINQALGVLGVRREADAGNNLWTVFNRAQENLLLGGYRAGGRRTRAINSVDRNYEINTQLWSLAESYAT